MKISETPLPGVLLIEPKVFGDARGFFLETWNRERYLSAGFPEVTFVQDNFSHSRQGTLRGLHFQRQHPQGKLVYVVRGAIFDVVVDIRTGSGSFGRWYGVELSAENHRQIWIPPGFAHGFCVLSDEADFCYKCTDSYHPEDEGGIIWNDPDIGIAWPVIDPLLSEKDRRYPRLAELALQASPKLGS